MPSLYVHPNSSFEPRFCLFIINSYYTKSKRLQSLNFLFYLYSGDFPCHHIIIMKELLSGSCIIMLKPATLLKVTLLHGCFSRFLNLQMILNCATFALSSYLFLQERSRKISSSEFCDTYSFIGSRNNKLNQFQPFLENQKASLATYGEPETFSICKLQQKSG